MTDKSYLSINEDVEKHQAKADEKLSCDERQTGLTRSQNRKAQKNVCRKS